MCRSDRPGRQKWREDRGVLPVADEDEHGAVVRQPVGDDARQHLRLIVGRRRLEEKGVHIMEIAQRRLDVRARQIGAHQHDRPRRELLRHLRGLREGVVPQRLADHGDARARHEAHEERAGGQGHD